MSKPKRQGPGKQRRVRLGDADMAWIVEADGRIRGYIPKDIDTPEDQVYGLLTLSKDLHDIAMGIIRAQHLDVEELAAGAES